MIRPGEIYMADFAEAGPASRDRVVSRGVESRPVRSLWSARRRRFAARCQFANCVPFRAGAFGFTSDCVAQCENLLSIDLAQLDLSGGPKGSLDDMAFREVIKAIGYVMESECEPV